MTAPLPVSQDAHPNHPDDAVEGARTPLKPAPVTSARATASANPPRTQAKRPPKKPVRARPVVDPGPPPPLPADLLQVDGVIEIAGVIVPPKPPAPPPVRTDILTEAEAEPEAEPVAEPEAEPVTEPEQFVDPQPQRFDDPDESVVVVADADDADNAIDADVPEVLIAESTDPATAALVVTGVSKRFGGTRAVDGIDLTVPAGTFYGLVGPNGAGKTTTLSMIAGLIRPDRGSIKVNGIDAVSDPIAAKHQMGVLPDRLRTFDRLTGRQLLHYYGVLRGLPSAVVESRAADLARAFDLSDALGRVVSDYSAGMVKKVMLAGAMIHSPRLLVLDEPFESVDPVSSAIILDILSTYVAHGGTVILSSHGMDLVERYCSRVAVIVGGQVLAEGTVAEVRGELTLEQRFIELAGGLSDVEGLEWLHTFSD